MLKNKRYNSFIIALLFLVTSCFMFTVANPINIVYAKGTTYYVSSSTGNDNNSGTSTSTPWKTIAKLNTITFQSGDIICLKAGDEWNHGFIANGSGTSTSPITLTSYGSGPRPRIKMNNEMLSWCISLTNVAGWKITNLELCNAEQGIMVRVLAGQYDKDYLWVENCYFHDIRIKEVNGYVWNDTTMQWGSGVYIYTNGSQSESSKLKNITIKNCFCDYCDSFFDMAIGNRVNTIKTLTIDGCTVMHSSWNTLSLMYYLTAPGKGCLVKNCVFSSNGGIRSTPFGGTDVMAGNADNTVIDNCEFNNRIRSSDDADGCGFDYEWGCENLHITNCSFYKNASSAIMVFNNPIAPPSSTGILIDNNLFVQNLQNPSSHHTNAGEINFSYSGSTGTVSNNVFYPLAGKSVWTGEYSGMTFSNNTNPGTKSIVATPATNVAAGEYSTNQMVTISCATSGAEIRYATNGSIPTATSTLYSGPVTVRGCASCHTEKSEGIH